MIDHSETGSQSSAFTRQPAEETALHWNRQETAADTTIFEVGAPADALYLIESGQVRVFQVGTDGSSRLAGILGAGDWCGLSALVDRTYQLRAVAVTHATLARLSTASLLDRLRAMNGVESGLLFYLAGALCRAQDETARLVFDDCSVRLIKALVTFSESAAASAVDDGVMLKITHEQLAQSVGAARETISLALTQLRRLKLLRTGRNRLYFNPGALRAFADRGSAGKASSDEPIPGPLARE